MKIDTPACRWILRLLLVVSCLLNVRENAWCASVRLLSGEVESLQQRIDLIHQANSSIELAYFQIRDDLSSGQLLAALVDAAQRGVTVRILVDGHAGSNTLPKPLVDYLIRTGVLVRERPVDVRYKIDLGRPRLHDKLFIVDRSFLIIGGRNIEEDYFGLGQRLYVDHDCLVIGSMVKDASSYFECRWQESGTGTPSLFGEETQKMIRKQVHPEWNQIPREKAYGLIACWLEDCKQKPLAARDLACRSLDNQTLELEDCAITFLRDRVGGSKKEPGSITSQIYAALKSARRSIEISTPYCVITPELKRILTDARDRGIFVSILTNSLESTDQIVAQAGFANERRWMLRSGIQLFEYQGNRVLHAKLIVIDGTTAIMGSHNLDYLSDRRNSEVGILVRDAAFAQKVRAVLLLDQSNADLLQRGKLWRYELRESDASSQELREFRRLRLVTPWIQRYL